MLLPDPNSVSSEMKCPTNSTLGGARYEPQWDPPHVLADPVAGQSPAVPHAYVQRLGSPPTVAQMAPGAMQALGLPVGHIALDRRAFTASQLTTAWSMPQ